MARVRRSRRSNELRRQFCGFLPSGWRLHGPHSKGREASRPAGAAGNEARAVYQYQDCQGARPYRAADIARSRRRSNRMKRREFITLLGGAAAAWPLAARAQQAERVPRRIGVLMSLAADDPEGPARITGFAQGLQELGWTVGANLRVDYRWTAGDADRSRTYAAELVALAPDVIL